MILTFFYSVYKGITPSLRHFFITHFSICHSFLDSYIVHDLARKQGQEFGAKLGEGVQGDTVAQSHKPSA
jgi:hypothetical protein